VGELSQSPEMLDAARRGDTGRVIRLARRRRENPKARQPPPAALARATFPAWSGGPDIPTTCGSSAGWPAI
jgi:hypothetical protein